MATGNPDFNTALISTTLSNYAKTLRDQIFENTILLSYFKKKGAVKYEDGGLSLSETLMYGTNGTVRSYSGYDEFDITPQEGMTNAVFDWKNVAGTLSISREELRKNSGEHRIVNLVESKARQLRMSMKDVIATMLYSDGAGNFGKDLDGLELIVADTPTSGTVGNIDRSDATNSWWRNWSTTGAKTTTPFDTLLGLMETMYNNCTRYGDGDNPDLIVCDQSTFEGYVSQLIQKQRFTGESADGSFKQENLKFKGGMITWDPYCPSDATHGRMYFLNSNYLRLTVDKDTDFITTDFITPNNQQVKTSQMLFMGNLTVTNCRKLGVIYEIDLT